MVEIEELAKLFWEMDPRRWPNKPDLIVNGFANTDIRGAGGLTYGMIAEECIRIAGEMVRKDLYGTAANPEADQ